MNEHPERMKEGSSVVLAMKLVKALAKGGCLDPCEIVDGCTCVKEIAKALDGERERVLTIALERCAAVEPFGALVPPGNAAKWMAGFDAGVEAQREAIRDLTERTET